MADAITGWAIPDTLCLHADANPQADVTAIQWVYFIQAGPSGPVKIGTTGDLKKRLAGLQTSTAADLVMLGVIPGGREKEAALHTQFQHLRMRGEWFVPDPDLLGFIRQQGAELLSLITDAADFILDHEMTRIVTVDGGVTRHDRHCAASAEHFICARKCALAQSLIDRAELLA